MIHMVDYNEIVKKSNFRKDTRAEHELGIFMDENYYSRLCEDKAPYLTFERETDLKLQYEGIDVIIRSDDNREIIIDEKSALYYTNNNLQTFAFELSFEKDGKVRDGWFVKNGLKTEYYMLIWPNARCKKDKKTGQNIQVDLAKLTSKDFTIVEAILLSKKKLLAYLASLGLTKEVLIDRAKQMREVYRFSGNNYAHEDEEGIDFLHYTYTLRLVEKPINLVIDKKKLVELADRAYFISDRGYFRCN